LNVKVGSYPVVNRSEGHAIGRGKREETLQMTTQQKRKNCNENNEWMFKNLIFKRVLTETSKRLEWNVRGFEK